MIDSIAKLNAANRKMWTDSTFSQREVSRAWDVVKKAVTTRVITNDSSAEDIRRHLAGFSSEVQEEVILGMGK